MKGPVDSPLENCSIQLKRRIGLVSAVNFLLINVVAQGVFIVPGKILAECGSVGMMFVMWIICGIISLMNCLPFVELSTVIPKSGSVYIYLLTAFNSFHPFFGGLPAFVFFWITCVIIQPCMNAVNAKMFASYSFDILKVFVSDYILSYETIIQYSLGALSIVLVGAINCFSVKLYVKSQDYLNYIIMGFICFILGCGVYLLISGKAENFNPDFKGTVYSVQGLTQAFLLGLFAYDGGWCITGVTEEVINPEKVVLRSIIITLIISIMTYLLVNITFLLGLTSQELATSACIISDFSGKLFGKSGEVVAAVVICICLITNTLCNIFYSSRLGFVAAREGHIAEILCSIHETQETPMPAVLVQVVLALFFFFLSGSVTFLIDMASFFSWMFYGLTMVSVFVLRKKMPKAHRPFKVWSVIPIIILAVCSYVVVVSLMITELRLLVVCAVCVTLIVGVYYVFVYKGCRSKRFGKMQRQVQRSLKLVPSFDND